MGILPVVSSRTHSIVFMILAIFILAAIISSAVMINFIFMFISFVVGTIMLIIWMYVPTPPKENSVNWVL
jgi:uncharacterized membrane protein YjjP (DUF1212 family)